MYIPMNFSQGMTRLDGTSFVRITQDWQELN
jgi:hypothetical protein